MTLIRYEQEDVIEETVIQVIQRFYHIILTIVVIIILNIVIVVIEIFVSEKLHGGQIV